VTRTLKNRIRRLEGASGGDLEIRLRAFAIRLGIAPDRLLAIAGDERERLAREIAADGMVTWEAICWLRERGLLGQAPQ
jgi:hypothetical protein